MPFITFTYKVGGKPKIYYGKWCFDDISDDHEGLDNEVRYIVKKGLNEYRKKNNMPNIKSKIHIGILSFSSNKYIPTYSTNKEIVCFDFYANENIYILTENYYNSNII
jgi:hypothetical protein